MEFRPDNFESQLPPVVNGVKNAFLRAAGRNVKYQGKANKLDAALTQLFQDWFNTEESGGLCVCWKADNRTMNGHLRVLSSNRLIQESSKFNLLNPPKYFDEFTPFIVDRRQEKKLNFIYSHGTFTEEALLAQRIALLSSKPSLIKKDSSIKLENCSCDNSQVDAIKRSLTHNLSIITGGPGAGKTFITPIYIANWVKAFQSINNGQYPTIYLAAPTGKARNRLKEEVLKAAESSIELKEGFDKGHISENTIHRWLKTFTSSGKFPSKSNPLECDLLVVDEASMIDNELAYRLFSVVDQERTSVLILGDKDQLVAVKPGAVFAALSDPTGVLKDAVSVLTKSYRFGEDEDIAQIAAGLRSGRNKKEYSKVFDELQAIQKKYFFYTPVIDKRDREELINLDSFLKEQSINYVKLVKKYLYGTKEPTTEELNELYRAIFQNRLVVTKKKDDDLKARIYQYFSKPLKELAKDSSADHYIGEVVRVSLKTDKSKGKEGNRQEPEDYIEGFLFQKANKKTSKKEWYLFSEKGEYRIPTSQMGKVEEAFDTRLSLLNKKGQILFVPTHLKGFGTLTAHAKELLRGFIGEYAKIVEKELLSETGAKDYKAIWNSLVSFRPLAAQRHGPMSLQSINDFCSSELRKRLSITGTPDKFVGKPIIIRKNDDTLGVANGDEGFLYKEYKEEPRDWEWFVFIGSAGNEGKKIALSLLPEYDTAFALTIHHSQGSGYEKVAVFLPHLIGDDGKKTKEQREADEETNKRIEGLATRELFYTAITRAKNNCIIFGTEDILRKCIETKTERTGGLTQRLEEYVNASLISS